MSKYKTYTKEKRLYFIMSILVYFLPFIITTACFLPIVKGATGFKIAVGFGIVVINAIPFLTGIFRSLFAHFPMLNIMAIVFLFVAGFFSLDFFMKSREIFCWIELAAATGSVVSCFLWAKYLKYAGYEKTMQATVKSGAFVLKGEVK